MAVVTLRPNYMGMPCSASAAQQTRGSYAVFIGLAAMGAGYWGHNPVRTAPSWVPLKHIEPVFSPEDACDVKFDREELSQLGSPDAIGATVERSRG